MNAAVIVQLALLLHGHLLTMHLVRPAAPAHLPLLVYATGDGGWRGKDLQTYNELVSWGYPLVGFSSPDYLNHLGKGVKTLTPAELAADYGAIIQFARTNLALGDERPVILVGVSRGAGLSVAAAGQGLLRDRLGGVVAVGLTKEEEYVWRLPRRRMPVMLEIYDYLPRLGTLPLAVVQSTHDGYLPAPAARALFGPDTEWRRFHAIEARNHSFSNARSAMYNAIKESLAWVTLLPRENSQ
jgi:pimeloyl-ACP methyl ester carboxylesterase